MPYFRDFDRRYFVPDRFVSKYLILNLLPIFHNFRDSYSDKTIIFEQQLLNFYHPYQSSASVIEFSILHHLHHLSSLISSFLAVLCVLRCSLQTIGKSAVERVILLLFPIEGIVSSNHATKTS